MTPYQKQLTREVREIPGVDWTQFRKGRKHGKLDIGYRGETIPGIIISGSPSDCRALNNAMRFIRRRLSAIDQTLEVEVEQTTPINGAARPEPAFGTLPVCEKPAEDPPPAPGIMTIRFDAVGRMSVNQCRPGTRQLRIQLPTKIAAQLKRDGRSKLWLDLKGWQPSGGEIYLTGPTRTETGRGLRIMDNGFLHPTAPTAIVGDTFGITDVMCVYERIGDAPATVMVHLPDAQDRKPPLHRGGHKEPRQKTTAPAVDVDNLAVRCKAHLEELDYLVTLRAELERREEAHGEETAALAALGLQFSDGHWYRKLA